MATSASARPPCAAGSFIASVAVPPDHPAYPRATWIESSLERAVQPARTRTLREPAVFTQWTFGDLTLIREIRHAGSSTEGPLASPSTRRQGCVALLRSKSGGAWPTLIVSPRAGAARAALERSSHRLGEDAELLSLLMPREWLEGAFPGAATALRFCETETGPGALLVGFLQQLVEQSCHVQGEQAKRLAIATRALVEACIIPAHEVSAPERPVEDREVLDRQVQDKPGGGHGALAPPSLASGMVERARLMVQRHMASPDFGPPQLGRLLAMSRSKLYRLLDGDGGVAHFINRERLKQARRDLMAPGEPLSVHAIANEAGFRDHSTFSRAFRREYGCSPTELREREQLARQHSGSAAVGIPLAPCPERVPCIACEPRRENGMNRPDLGF